MKEINIRDYFAEEDIKKLQNDLNDPSNSIFTDNLVDKSTLKKTLFKILRQKLQRENYLINVLNYLEKDINYDISNTTINSLNTNGNEYKSLTNFLSNNTHIKLNQKFISNNNLENLRTREISVSKVKALITNPNALNDIKINNTLNNFLSFSEDVISNIETQEFNILKLEEQVGKENTLSVIACYIFTNFYLYYLFPYMKLENFFRAITLGYHRENPYHTDLHAADVTQSCMLYAIKADLKGYLKLNDKDLASLFISCIVHDYKHPGVNNAFLTNIHSPIAIRYNDTDVLEAYHISQTFKLIKSDEKYNIFENMSNEDYRYCRKRMIGFVLATDMVFHFKQFNFLKDKIKEFEIVKGNNRDKVIEAMDEKKFYDYQQDLLEIIVHACDISNPTKPWSIYPFWAEACVSEFFLQGDLEKKLGMKVSQNFDRETTSLPGSQIGFMNFIVAPFFLSLTEIFPELEFLSDNVKINLENMKKLKEEEDKKKEEKK